MQTHGSLEPFKHDLFYKKQGSSDKSLLLPACTNRSSFKVTNGTLYLFQHCLILRKWKIVNDDQWPIIVLSMFFFSIALFNSLLVVTLLLCLMHIEDLSLRRVSLAGSSRSHCSFASTGLGKPARSKSNRSELDCLYTGLSQFNL